MTDPDQSRHDVPEAPLWGTYRPSAAARLLIAAARHTPLGRGVLRPLIYKSFVRRHAHPVDCELWGVPVRLHAARNPCERKALLRPDRMDPLEHALLRTYMRNPGAVFVDVGANAGLYSLDAALNAGPGASIVTIEPNPELLARFAFNIAAARAAGKVRADVSVHPVNLAVSDRDGEGLLSTQGSEGKRCLIEGDGGSRVDLRRLSTILGDLGLSRIDVLKVDVEGHEDRVLPPYLETCAPSGWPQVIIIEHLSRAGWAVDCIGLAMAKGYRASFITRNNTALVWD